jgi:hypothetical protein
MTSRFKAGCALVLALLAAPVAARTGPSTDEVSAPARFVAVPASTGVLLAGASRTRMRVGLTIVDAQPAAAGHLPAPAELEFPASPNAVMCRSDDHGYRECRTPFHGPVVLSREVAATRCIEDVNWGWRNGAVWVDRGCSAVFVRTGA